jgi:hypothetical protein
MKVPIQCLPGWMRFASSSREGGVLRYSLTGRLRAAAANEAEDVRDVPQAGLW